jgi:hypothetical protein
MGLVGAEHRDLHQRFARGCGLPLDVVDEPSPDPAVGVCSDHASSSNRLLDAVRAVVDAPDDGFPTQATTISSLQWIGKGRSASPGRTAGSTSRQSPTNMRGSRARRESVQVQGIASVDAA